MVQEYIHHGTRWSTGGLAILVLVGGLAGLAYWQLGEVTRRADRVHWSLRPGMSYGRVEDQMVGRYLCAYQVHTNDQWQMVPRVALAAALPSSPARLHLVILGMTPKRVSFFAELNSAGTVTNVTQPIASD